MIELLHPIQLLEITIGVVFAMLFSAVRGISFKKWIIAVVGVVWIGATVLDLTIVVEYLIPDLIWQYHPFVLLFLHGVGSIVLILGFYLSRRYILTPEGYIG